MSSTVSAAADAGDDTAVAACFLLRAAADPGVMPRVLELFAKRGLVPQRWQSNVAGPGGTLTIDIRVAGLARDTVDYVARCMRGITGVDTVFASVAGIAQPPFE